MGRIPTDEPEFKELQKIRAFDRQQHIQKALEAGMSREEAERHADDEIRHWSPTHIEKDPREE